MITQIKWPESGIETYDEDLLLSIQVGKIALLTRGRNAWHSTWVKHYFKHSSVHLNIRDAQQSAEKMRGPGNVFYIVEAPAIQLIGAKSNVVLCDSHAEDPFSSFAGSEWEIQQTALRGRYILGLHPGISVQDAVRLFQHDSRLWLKPEPSEHSLRSGSLPIGTELDKDFEGYTSLRSEAVGVDYALSWRPHSIDNKYVSAGCFRIAQTWSESTKSLYEDNESTYEKSAALIRYRQDEISELPFSIWNHRSKERVSTLQKLSVQRGELQSLLADARYELASAKEDRMKPAETSAGMKAQRQRLEAATMEVDRLETQLDEAQQRFRELYASRRS